MNELDFVKDWYVISRDSNYEMSRLAKENKNALSEKTIFYTMPVAKVIDSLRIAREEIDDFAILSMVAVFEQKLLSVVEQIYNSIYSDVQKDFADLSGKRELLEFFHEKTLKRWHFEDILELFKNFVDRDFLSQIKSIYKYRNWVAHGKYKNKPTSLDPLTVYEKLSEFLEMIEDNDE